MQPLAAADFRWEGYSWVSDVVLPEWRGWSVGDPSLPDEPSTGEVQLVFAPEGRDDAPLSEAELELVNWFVERHDDVSAVVRDAIHRAYGSIRDVYAPAYRPEDVPTVLPDLASPRDLRSVVALGSVSVHQLAPGGEPYLGFGFECRWDVEHGLGVLVHGMRVVEVGMEDTAFLLWIARRDAESAG